MIQVKEVLKTKKFWFGTLMALSSQPVGLITSRIIEIVFPNRFIANDLLMLFLPYSESLEYLTDILALTMMFMFAFYILKFRFNIYPLVTTAIGVGYAMRGVMTLLTPLARPTGFNFNHGISGYFYRHYGTEVAYTNEGMFPSGHLMVSTLYLFFIDRKKHPKFFWLMFIVNAIDALLMVWSRGHYSIDIAGAVMIAIIVGQNIWKYKSKLVFLDEKTNNV